MPVCLAHNYVKGSTTLPGPPEPIRVASLLLSDLARG